MAKQRRADDSTIEYVDVHTLGEMEYCHRAGVIAHETRTDLHRWNFRWFPDLSYSLPYDMQELLDEYRECQATLLKAAALFGGVVSVVLLVTLLWDFESARVYLLVAIPPAVFLIREFMHLLSLHEQVVAVDSAKPRRLDDLLREKTPINWWDLVKEYDVVTPQMYKSKEIMLCGAPFRLLTIGDQSIPVIESRSENEEVKSTHRVRLEAYAYLIRTCEQRLCSWGVVIFEGTKQGFAVPLDSKRIWATEDRVRRLRETLQNEREGNHPPAGSASACRGCPRRKPRRIRAGGSNTRLLGKALPQYDLGNGLHCDCGDRFCWTPPPYNDRR